MTTAAILFLMDFNEPKRESDHQKYLENNYTKFECNPSNSS